MKEKKKEICSHYGTCHQVVNRGVCIADAAEIECGYDSRKQISPLEILKQWRSYRRSQPGYPHWDEVTEMIEDLIKNPHSVIEKGKTEGWLK